MTVFLLYNKPNKKTMLHELLQICKDYLASNPIMLLFLTVGLGYILSEIKYKGVGLGVAAVLFVGLGLGAWGGESFRLPEIIGQLGLMLFVYTIGLHAGPAFFVLLRKQGLAIASLAIFTVLISALATWAFFHLFGLNPVTTVGLFCGSITNTPALAAATESLHGQPGASLLTVGYSVAYPLAVILPILLAQFVAKIRQVNVAQETQKAEKAAGGHGDPPVGLNVRVTIPGITTVPLAHTPLVALGIRVSRIQRGEDIQVPGPDTYLRIGDLIRLVGTTASLEQAVPLLGEEIRQAGPDTRRDKIDFRRILLTNSTLVGRKLGETDIEEKFGAIVTRIRRGDTEFVPNDDTILERGDRIRVVAPTDRMPEISKYIGDSFRAITETDFFSFALGILLGILLGNWSIPVGGGLNLRLGLAGGPMLVALVLGAVGRTGPIFWTLPLNINFTFRQLGMVLFFAGVGIKSGGSFVQAFASEGLTLMACGAAITTISALTLLTGSMYLLRMDWVTATGTLAGGQTQPAILSFVGGLAQSEAPNTAYVSIMPTAMIAKILAAQILLWLLVHHF